MPRFDAEPPRGMGMGMGGPMPFMGGPVSLAGPPEVSLCTCVKILSRKFYHA